MTIFHSIPFLSQHQSAETQKDVTQPYQKIRIIVIFILAMLLQHRLESWWCRFTLIIPHLSLTRSQSLMSKPGNEINRRGWSLLTLLKHGSCLACVTRVHAAAQIKCSGASCMADYRWESLNKRLQKYM